MLSALSEADGGRLRFSELMRAVERHFATDVDDNSATPGTRRDIDAAGFTEVPPRVEYTLTARGEGLLVPVKALIAWLLHEWPEIAKSRREYDQKIGPSLRA